MNVELVWKNRVYTKNFVSDFFEQIRNIVGGRLKQYEQLLDTAIKETWQEFKKDYPTATNIRVDTEHMVQGSIMVTITGEIDASDK